MDFQDAIDGLKRRKREVELAIAELEHFQNFNGAVIRRKPKRGRKSMGHEERLRVSERMKRYWASRHEASDPESPVVIAARIVST